MNLNKVSLNTLLVFLFFSLAATNLFAEEEGNEANNKRISIEYELDPYYTSLDAYIPLTDKPIPDVGEKEEVEIYKDLFWSSFVPRFLVLEASVNPLPNLGVYIKSNNPDFYRRGEISRSLNVIKAITAGFEEPYAASFFIGNVVNYASPGENKEYGNKGYMGYLISAGNYHIKDNELIQDNWYEVEWKFKGDRKTPANRLHWSFRIGGKFHDNPEITDILYFSIRRSRVDYQASAASILKNSGFEYTVDMSTKNMDVIRHYFFVDKKWPLKGMNIAFSMAVGFIWESDQKYSGSLIEKEKRENLQFLLRPNISF